MALDQAIEVFRELGYEAASMAELERATGLNKSSIYNTFGSKEGLFRQALTRYENGRLSAIHDILATGAGGLDDLHRALDLQRAECESPWGGQGCLAVNTMTELGRRGESINGCGVDFRRALTELLRMPLERAVAAGEMAEADVPLAAALLLSLTLGVGVLMRGSPTVGELGAHFEAAHAAVESWRLSPPGAR